MDPSPAYEAEVASVDVTVARLAWRQHGVVTRGQMEELGLRGSAIDRRVRKAGLRRVHRGVYVVGAVRLTDRGRWLAAVLACGSDAVLSHFAAAALWDLQRAPTTRIDVTAPGKRKVEGVRCHIARSLSNEDRTTIDGIPATPPNRTLLDLAALHSPQRLRSTLDAAQRPPGSFEQDRAKDLKLHLAGEDVIRVTHRQIVHGPRELVADVRRLLGSTAG